MNEYYAVPETFPMAYAQEKIHSTLCMRQFLKNGIPENVKKAMQHIEKSEEKAEREKLHRIIQ